MKNKALLVLVLLIGTSPEYSSPTSKGTSGSESTLYSVDELASSTVLRIAAMLTLSVVGQKAEAGLIADVDMRLCRRKSFRDILEVLAVESVSARKAGADDRQVSNRGVQLHLELEQSSSYNGTSTRVSRHPGRMESQEV